MSSPLDRRQLLLNTTSVAATALLLPTAVAARNADPLPSAQTPAKTTPKFRYALNTATIRGQNLPLDQQIDVTIKAGYDSIEPWIGDISTYKDKGGSLADIKKRLADAGLTVDSAIGFAPWIADDDRQRAKGLEQARREMDLVLSIGGTGMAAPPAGATDQANLDLRKAADRYRALLEIGDKIGIVPQVEVWGFSKCLSRLSECAYVAIESRHPKACVLADVYHLYKGGSDHASLGLLSGSSMRCLHMNDYPANPPRDKISDADRIYPGDGIAPIKDLLRTLHKNGYQGVLSLELFHRGYWMRDPLDVIRVGLDKMKLLVRAAFA